MHKLLNTTPPPPSRSKKGYWLSFMDGLQRVVLFTTDQDTNTRVLKGNKTEQPKLELALSLIAVGISLVDDIRGQEVAYIGIPQWVDSVPVSTYTNNYLYTFSHNYFRRIIFLSSCSLPAIS